MSGDRARLLCCVLVQRFGAVLHSVEFCGTVAAASPAATCDGPFQAGACTLGIVDERRAYCTRSSSCFDAYAPATFCPPAPVLLALLICVFCSTPAGVFFLSMKDGSCLVVLFVGAWALLVARCVALAGLPDS